MISVSEGMGEVAEMMEETALLQSEKLIYSNSPRPSSPSCWAS